MPNTKKRTLPGGGFETVPLSAEEEEDFAAREAAETVEVRCMRVLRLKRDILLKASDEEMLSDRPGSPGLAAYRQALRDLPANTPDPANPTWPTPPE